MENKVFHLMVPYKGKEVLAAAREEDIPLVMQFKVMFPDGYQSTFYYYDDVEDKDKQWMEEKLGVTELSKVVGEKLDEYLERKVKLAKKPVTKKPLKIVKDDLNF